MGDISERMVGGGRGDALARAKRNAEQALAGTGGCVMALLSAGEPPLGAGIKFCDLYSAREDSSRERDIPRHAVRSDESGKVVATVTLSGYRVGVDPSPRDWTRLFAAAPDMFNAIGPAITALAFAEEEAQRRGDAVAFTQNSAAKRGLIEALNKAQGASNIRDASPSTPSAACIKTTRSAS